MGNKIIQILKVIRGRKLFELKIFGIQLLLITDTKVKQYNVYMLWIPLLRIVNNGKTFAFNILPCVWIYKSIKLLLTKWRFEKTESRIRLSFLGKNVYSVSKIKPYNFPAALFRDM